MSATETNGRSSAQSRGQGKPYSSTLGLGKGLKCCEMLRIALLEGERRSFENVKSDFMRRIKMLEYALRVERCVLWPSATALSFETS